MTDDDWKFSWPKPTSIYASDGPHLQQGQVHLEIVDGLVFEMSVVGSGLTTGRSRYAVRCQACATLLHRGTTGPSFHILDHLMTRHTPRG